MDQFTTHAKHNNAFLEKICEQFPDCYYDWKITCMFYVAIHYLKALAVHRNKNIGDKHVDINRNIKRGNHHPTMPISDTACQNYMNLFNYSQTARYDGIEDIETFNTLRKADFEHAKKCFTDFEKFIKSSGVILQEEIADAPDKKTFPSIDLK